MKNKGSDKSLLQGIDIKKLFWKYLNILQVPFDDPCCEGASTTCKESARYVTSMEEGDGQDPTNPIITVNEFGGIIVWTWDTTNDVYPDGLLKGTLIGGFGYPMSAWLIDGGDSNVISIGIVGQNLNEIWLYTGAPGDCCERFEIELRREACPVQGFVGTPDDISLALEYSVLPANANLVSTWNTFFNLPTNGTPFQNVYVSGNIVTLYGANQNIIIVDNLFKDNIDLLNIQERSVDTIISLGNNAFENSGITFAQLPSVVTVGDSCFKGCTSLSDVNLFFALTVGDNAFENTILTTCSLASCTSLGSTVGDNSVFLGVIGQIVGLTVPIALQTIDAGNPDGDIVYLAANNTETITYV